MRRYNVRGSCPAVAAPASQIGKLGPLPANGFNFGPVGKGRNPPPAFKFAQTWRVPEQVVSQSPTQESMRFRGTGSDKTASRRLRPSQIDRGALTAKATGDVVPHVSLCSQKGKRVGTLQGQAPVPGHFSGRVGE